LDSLVVVFLFPLLLQLPGLLLSYTVLLQPPFYRCCSHVLIVVSVGHL
jgi:hypothetical protein